MSVRSSRLEVFCKKGVHRNFTKFTGKCVCQTLAQVFSCEFCEISKNTFFHRTALVTASSQLYFNVKILFLTLSLRRPISYRNQSIDLINIGLRHERVNTVSISTFASLKQKFASNYEHQSQMFILKKPFVFL